MTASEESMAMVKDRIASEGIQQADEIQAKTPTHIVKYIFFYRGHHTAEWTKSYGLYEQSQYEKMLTDIVKSHRDYDFTDTYQFKVFAIKLPF